MKNVTAGIIVVLGIVGLSAIIILLATLPVMWIWNWLMPDLFDFQTITFWQALALTALCSLLFKNTTSSSSK